jgi:acyl-coenzyme A synthetase/AMP-(fatty) acid ligase
MIFCHQVDVNTKQLIKFDEVESLSRRVASALTRRGFKKGDTLYYVTFESARLYVILLAVWRLGGITRGCYQRDTTGKFVEKMWQFQLHFIPLSINETL